MPNLSAVLQTTVITKVAQQTRKPPVRHEKFKQLVKRTACDAKVNRRHGRHIQTFNLMSIV